MNYTKLDYFIYKLSLFFSGQFFNYLVLLLLVLGFIIFAAYDFNNDGPIFSSNSKKETRNNQMRHTNETKFSLKKEVLIGAIPIILIISLFGVKKIIMHSAESPDTIILDGNKKSTAYTGNVVWLNYKRQETGISNKKMVDPNSMQDMVVARVNNSPAPLNSGNISPYSGTTMDLMTFAKLKNGDRVKIVCPSYKFKYKNHDEYSNINSEDSNQQLKLLKELKVNGTLERVKDKKVITKKKVNQKNKSTRFNQNYY